MTDFTTISDVVNALAAAGNGGPGTRQDYNKNSITVTSGLYYSGWTLSGFPAAGSAPTTWAHPTKATLGSWAPNLVNPSSGETMRLLLTESTIGIAGENMIWSDRVGHMGGLSGTSTSAQTVGATLTTPAADGRCAANGSDVQWFLEVYTGLGSTAVTATIAVTYSDDSTGNISVSIPASVIAGRLMSVIPTNGKSIKGVTSVTLSASTGTAGNFGVTAYKRLASNFVPTASWTDKSDWAYLGMPKVGSNACICAIFFTTSTGLGTLVGNFIIGAA